MLRAEAGLSLKKVATAIGVSDAAVCKWESGISEPKLCYLIKLSELFDCSIDFLAGKTNEFTGAAHDRHIHSQLPIGNEQRILSEYRKLPDDKKALLEKTLEVWNK